MEIVSPDLKRLFTPHVIKMRTSLEPGLSEITWTNFDWIKFTDHVRRTKIQQMGSLFEDNSALNNNFIQ